MGVKFRCEIKQHGLHDTPYCPKCQRNTMIEEVVGTPKQGLILLACRGGAPEALLRPYKGNVKDCVIWSLAGPGGQWYPPPNGAHDQREALRGLPKSVKMIKNLIKRMAKQYNLKHEDIHLAGHSAGAVVALQVVAHSQESLGSVHIHCGAILDPASLPKKNNDTSVFVFHSENDMVFSWTERYLPMKKALIEKGYNCAFVEHRNHGHSVRNEDIKAACKWLGRKDADVCRDSG